MITRDDVLASAITNCLKELYSLVEPKVKWDSFVKQNKAYSIKYRTWERWHKLSKQEAKTKQEQEEFDKFPKEWKDKIITECIGPRPYEFYFLPKKIYNDIFDSYVSAYKLDAQGELENTIEILKNYCNKPIVDKYIEEYTDENGNFHPGYRGYDHPDNLEKEIFSILKENSNYWKSAIGESNPSDLSKELQNKFFEFLDMAGHFYCWNRDLNKFITNVSLGPSPSSDKQTVIDNWKKYRNRDISIDEEQMKKDFYGDDE